MLPLLICYLLLDRSKSTQTFLVTRFLLNAINVFLLFNKKVRLKFSSSTQQLPIVSQNSIRNLIKTYRVYFCNKPILMSDRKFIMWKRWNVMQPAEVKFPARFIGKFFHQNDFFSHPFHVRYHVITRETRQIYCLWCKMSPESFTNDCKTLGEIISEKSLGFVYDPLLWSRK